MFKEDVLGTEEMPAPRGFRQARPLLLFLLLAGGADAGPDAKGGSKGGGEAGGGSGDPWLEEPP